MTLNIAFRPWSGDLILMNAVLAKPIPHVLVYSSRGIDKALISIKHCCSAGGFAAPRRATIGRYWGGIIELLHCTMSGPGPAALP